jgi:hypothetical protein
MGVAGTDTSMMQSLVLAARAAGGCEALAEKLGVTSTLLQEWLAGTTEPPVATYVRALDVLIAASKRAAR